MLACKNGRTEAANVLLKHGADIEQKKRVCSQKIQAEFGSGRAQSGLVDVNPPFVGWAS